MALVSDLQVWVMALSGGNPVWDDTAWVVQPRLVPAESDYVLDNQGAATFKLLRATRVDDAADGVITDAFLPTRGQYIAITDDVCTNPSTGGGNVYYTGVIQAWQFEKFFNSTEVVGMVQAIGFGQVLDQIPLQNLHEIDPGGYPPGDPLLSHPTFNMEGMSQGQIIGNMKVGPDGNGQFTSDPTAAGVLWDRLSILTHVCAYIADMSGLIPSLSLGFVDPAVSTLLSAPFEEVLPTDGMTIKGLLDYLCGPSRGLSWTVDDDGAGGWEIDIYSATDIAVGSIPAALSTNVTLDSTCVSVRLHAGALDAYDGLKITGANHVCCGTVSPIDGTMDSGWASAQETDYANPLSTLASPANYRADQKLAIANAIRASGTLADVYTRFLLATGGGVFWCKGVAGVPDPGSKQFLCPKLVWSGTALTVSGSADASPNAPEARLLPKLPWLTGVLADGTDTRIQEQKTRPAQIEPLVMTYEMPGVYYSTDADPVQFADLLHPPFSWWSETPSVSMDDRGPGIRIRYAIPHMLGLNHFSIGASNAWDEYDPAVGYGASGNINPASDWEKLICTVALQADQPVMVEAYRSGVTSTTARNILRIRRPDLQCWLVRQYTIMGWKIDGSGLFKPDEVPADTFVRNDYPVAQKLLDELSAYAFRKRTCATIILEGIQLTAWGLVGTMIDQLIEPDGSTAITLSTMVTSVRFDYNPEAPRTIISTGDPALPVSQALAPTIPYFGGSVSVPQAGTTVGASQRQDTHGRTMAKNAINPSMARNGPPPKAWGFYGTVRWFFDPASGGQLAECQLYNAAGTVLGTADIGWIDIAQSIAPTTFGDGAIYELSPIGQLTKSVSGVSHTRRGFRIVRTVKEGSIAFTAVATAAGSGSGVVGLLSTTGGGSPIQTTIAGTAADNYLPMQVPTMVGGTTTPVSAAALYEIPNPPAPASNETIIPLCLSGTRALNAGGGGMEYGEYFTIEYCATIYQTSSAVANHSWIIHGTITCQDVGGSFTVIRHTAVVTMFTAHFSSSIVWTTGAADTASIITSGNHAGGSTILTCSTLAHILALTSSGASPGYAYSLTLTPTGGYTSELSFTVRGGVTP